MVKRKGKAKSSVSISKRIPEGVHCQDCANSFDYHEKDLNGEYFMCKCPFQEYSMFLRQDVCDLFKPKQNKKTEIHS